MANDETAAVELATLASGPPYRASGRAPVRAPL